MIEVEGMVWKMPEWDHDLVEEIEVFVDSDWAKRADRRRDGPVGEALAGGMP